MAKTGYFCLLAKTCQPWFLGYGTPVVSIFGLFICRAFWFGLILGYTRSDEDVFNKFVYEILFHVVEWNWRHHVSTHATLFPRYGWCVSLVFVLPDAVWTINSLLSVSVSGKSLWSTILHAHCTMCSMSWFQRQAYSNRLLLPSSVQAAFRSSLRLLSISLNFFVLFLLQSTISIWLHYIFWYFVIL